MCASNTPALDAWNAKYGTPEGLQREIERQRSRTRHNEASALGHARREGRAEGRREVEIEIAIKLLELGVPVETIIQDTSLTLADVESLRQ